MSDQFERLKAALADRYAIERELGSGGMAIVYLAEDLKHRRKVAVKVLRPELAATLGPERFLREIEIAAQLTHPHILPLFDSGEASGFLYYVMPYIKGESLRERLDSEEKLSVDDGIRLTEQVASALTYAHEQGVVHRDIKPENILLAGDQAIVADFGIARAIQVAGGERLTGTGLAIGTPAYMSPEQAMGEENVDGRSDVYALGCVVYETVSGRTPFEGSTPQALVAKHVADTVPGLRASDPAIPVFVERAVEKALAKQPADRFQSPSAFAEALTTQKVVARVTRRLAVLPFTNLMNDPEQEFLVQGMHEAVISELTQAGVTVIARSSVMPYRNSDKPARDIAGELRVDTLIEGSAFRAGDSVGIQARLIDGDTEEYLWSHSYDGDLRNVFGLYRDVARAIADEIQVARTPQAEARLASARPVNPEAYEAYLKGRFHWYQLTPEHLETALQYFELALQKDPEYALAHTGIAQYWAGRSAIGAEPPREVWPKVKTAATRALDLDETVAEAHDMLAWALTWYDYDWPAAEREFRRAIDLNPNYAHAHLFYGLFLNSLRRWDEARPQTDRALELDPHNPFFQWIFGFELLAKRRYDEAIPQIRKSLPEFAQAHWGLWMAFHAKQMYEEAMLEAKAALPYFAAGVPEAADALARGYAEAGYPGAMRRAAETLAERSNSTYVSAHLIAELYACAGDKERALEWLEKAYEERRQEMVYLSVFPTWDGLRDDPRFQDLLRRMNLPAADNTDLR